MQKTHFGQHGPECFGCKIQDVQFDPRATPSRRNSIPPAPPRYNAWERSTPTDSRGMPFLGPDLQPLTQKKFTEQRHRIEESKRHPESVKDTKEN